jgi:hypothetical protein
MPLILKKGAGNVKPAPGQTKQLKSLILQFQYRRNLVGTALRAGAVHDNTMPAAVKTRTAYNLICGGCGTRYAYLRPVVIS